MTNREVAENVLRLVAKLYNITLSDNAKHQIFAEVLKQGATASEEKVTERGFAQPLTPSSPNSQAPAKSLTGGEYLPMPKSGTGAGHKIDVPEKD